MTNTPRTVQLPSSKPRPHRARNAVLIGGAGLVLLGAGYVALGHVGVSHQITTASVSGVREIVVDVDAGPVTLAGGIGIGTDVEVRTTVRRSLTSAPIAGHRLDAGVLRISGTCPPFSMNCHVEEQVTVPPGVPVRVSTSAGGVEGSELDVPVLDVDTSAGSVTASFVRPPQDVRIATSAGSVELRVPDVGYRVEADAAVGEVQIDVVQDRRSPRTLHVETSAGNVAVLPR